MSREPVEIRFCWYQNNGTVAMQSGIYVPDDMTLKEVQKFALESKSLPIPDFIEFPIVKEEEE